MSEQWRESFFDDVAVEREKSGFVPLVVLVGSNRLGEDLRAELHRRHGGWLGAYTLTFIDLATRLASTRGPVRPLAPTEFLHALATRLVAESDGHEFERVRAFAGTPGAFLATFEDLIEAGWTHVPLANGASANQKEIDRLYRRFREGVETAGYDFPGTRIEASAAAAQSFSHVYGTSRLHVVGLYDINPTQSQLLKALDAAIDVRYHIPPVVFTSLWAAGLSKNHTGIVTHTEAYSADRTRDQVLSCPDRRSEICEIAREIHALIASGVAATRIAVALRHPSTYRDLVVDVFRDFGIGLRLAGGRRPDECASVRLAAAFLRIARDVDSAGQPRLRRAGVVAFLSASSAARVDGAERWDRLSRRVNIRARNDWETRLSDLATGTRRLENQGATDREDATSLLGAWKDLRAALTEIAAQKSHADAARVLVEVTRRMSPEDDAWDDVMAAFESLGVADQAGLGFDVLRFLDRALDALANVSTKAGVNERNGVSVIDMSAVRGTRFDHVFIPGCVEGEIPYVGREDPILIDADRVALNMRMDADRRLPIFAERNRNERNLFDLACRSATRGLVLTFARQDTGLGRASAPSPYLVATFVASMSLGDFEKSPCFRVVPSSATSEQNEGKARNIREHDIATARGLDRRRTGLGLEYLKSVSPGFGLRLRRQAARFTTNKLGGYHGLCETPQAAALLSNWREEKPFLSVTDVETYVQCPRKFLFSSVLRIEAPQSPDDALALGHDARGKLLHEVLAGVVKHVSFEDAETALRDAYQKLATSGETTGGILDEYELATLTKMLRLFWDANAAWSEGGEIVSTEERLRPSNARNDENFPALSGRVDRIDKMPDGFLRIIDYKTGRVKNSLTGKDRLDDDDFNLGQTLQLPLYASALVAEGVASPGRIACEYRYLRNEKGEDSPARVRLSANALESRFDDLGQIVSGVMDGIRRARFAPRPDVAALSASICDYCDYRRICDGASRRRVAELGADERHVPWLARLRPPVSAAEDDHDA